VNEMKLRRRRTRRFCIHCGAVLPKSNWRECNKCKKELYGPQLDSHEEYYFLDISISEVREFNHRLQFL